MPGVRWIVAAALIAHAYALAAPAAAQVVCDVAAHEGEAFECRSEEQPLIAIKAEPTKLEAGPEELSTLTVEFKAGEGWTTVGDNAFVWPQPARGRIELLECPDPNNCTNNTNSQTVYYRPPEAATSEFTTTVRVTVTLTKLDNGVTSTASNSASATLTVTPPEVNLPPTVSISHSPAGERLGDKLYFPYGSTITFTANASDPDGNAVFDYDWHTNLQSAFIDPNDTRTVTFDAPDAPALSTGSVIEDVEVTVIVQEQEDSSAATTEQVVFGIGTPPNHAPTITSPLTCVPDELPFTGGDESTCTIGVEDVDPGDEIQIVWTSDGGESLEVDANDPLRATFTSSAHGLGTEPGFPPTKIWVSVGDQDAQFLTCSNENVDPDCETTITYTGVQDVGLVFFPANVEVDEGADTDYTVKLATEPAADVAVSVTSSDTSAVTVSPASLTFTTSTWSTAQKVMVKAVRDDDTDSETVMVSHSGVGVSDEDLTVEVTDTSDVGLVFSPAKLVVVEEEGTAEYTVRLSAPPPTEVWVNAEFGGTRRARCTWR